MLVGVLARVKVSGGELITGGWFQLKLLSAGSSQVIGLRVEAESPGKSQSSHNLHQITQQANRNGKTCLGHKHEERKRVGMSSVSLTSGEVTNA